MSEDQCLISIRGEEEEKCSICTGDLEDDVISLPCGRIVHQFHSECIKELIEKNSNQNEIACPLCRKIYKFTTNGEYMISIDTLWPIYKYSIPLIYLMSIIIPSAIVINYIIFYNWYMYLIDNERALIYIYLSTVYTLVVIIIYFNIFYRSIYAVYSVKHKKYDNLLHPIFRLYANTISEIGLYVSTILNVYTPLIIYYVLPESIKYQILMLFIIFMFVILLLCKIVFNGTTEWYSRFLDDLFYKQKMEIEAELYKSYNLIVDVTET